ncbi:VapC toxin family PIN domain ribonuclease [Mycobacterium celatum]|uniref:VapC toxin family PIN domain ribonuclease n=1 Tax=Mycobacterium celatum TaxID=28045 RepID=UPI001E4CDA2F|nr:VapC toxin family PIN domain ribonuclease [Mycobacterium celatum]
MDTATGMAFDAFHARWSGLRRRGKNAPSRGAASSAPADRSRCGRHNCIADAEALYSARGPAEYEQLWADRRVAYEYLPTDDQYWQTALGAQRALARTGQHRAVGMVELLTATLAAAHQPAVVHYDADFDTAATVLRFQHRWVLPRRTV